jgi:haloalkane dehalogenase
MGFGKSETPQDREYTLRTHVENLAALIDDLDLRDINFVLQDWGGPIGGVYTLLHPDRVKRVFAMNTVLPLPVPGTDGLAVQLLQSRWFRWILAGQQEGYLEEVLGNLGSTVLSVMKVIGFENTAAVDDTWIRAYSAPFPNRAECKGGIAFPLDAVSGVAIQYQSEMAVAEACEAFRSKPVMFAEGMRDHAIPPALALGNFRAQFPDAPVVELPGAGHFCQEDVPETLVALIQQFIQAT